MHGTDRDRQSLSIGSGVAVSFLDMNGLGVAVEQLTPSQIDAFSKVSSGFRSSPSYILTGIQALFASQMLFVATLCFIKLSIVVLLWLITPAREHRRLLMATAAFVAVSGIVSEFTEAFQCQVPDTWRSLGGNKCFDQVTSLCWTVESEQRLTRFRWHSGGILAPSTF